MNPYQAGLITDLVLLLCMGILNVLVRAPPLHTLLNPHPHQAGVITDMVLLLCMGILNVLIRAPPLHIPLNPPA